MVFEEVELDCEVCGKKVRAIKRKDSKIDTFLCQRCGKED